MNSKTQLMLSAAVAVITMTARGANVTKADNSTTLDLGGSWVSGNAPTTSDVATWDSTVATAANCTNILAASTNWGGVEVLNPVAPVTVNNSGGAVLALGGSGIDLNEAGTAQNLLLNLPVYTAGDQSWTVESGRQITFGSSSTIITNGNTVTVNGQIVCNNGFSIDGLGALNVASGSFSMSTASGNPFGVGNDVNGGGTVNQNGGTVSVAITGGTSGSYKASMNIGGAGSALGVYNLNSGSLTDVTANTFGFCNPGAASGATGTLNISGGSASFYSLRLGNNGGHGFVNVTNGSLTVSVGEFSIGRGTGGIAGSQDDGTLSIYGGVVSAPGIGVNVPLGNGPGIVNMYGGSFNIGSSLLVPAKSTGSGTVNIYGGSLIVTNNLDLPGGASGTTGSGTVNLNGGLLAVSSIAVLNGSASYLELNGGTLKARISTTSFIANTNMLTVHVDSGGAIIDTTNVNITIAAALQSNANPDGGLTKLGSGTLTLTAPNGYNGPTVIGAGTLSLSTTNNNSYGAVTVSNAATLDTALATAGTSLTVSTLTDGTSGGGGVTNIFDLGSFGNASAPLINAASLTASGVVYVIVNGSGLGVGTIPLIKYTESMGGSGTFSLVLVAGATGFVTNDTSAHSINLVITGTPKLTWRALINTNWDTSTANWVDTNNTATVFVNGAQIYFDDSASNTLVNLTNAFSPSVMNLENSASNYIFGGSGSISGSGGLIKLGAGTVVMGLTNNIYSGNTIISNGVYQLAVKNAIPSGTGKGNVTLEGKLDLAGFNQTINGFSGQSGVVDNSGATPVVFGVGSGGGNGAD